MTDVVKKNAPDIADIEKREQPLSTAYNSEMGPREVWNKKNPPTEAVLIKNLKTTDLTPREYRNTKARFYRLGHDIRLQPHLSELPPLGASVNHRHTTEAVIYIVSGVGHSVISWDGVNEERIDWEEGDMFSFPVWMWHQHFNDSETESCRYLAIQDTFAIKALGLHAIERFPENKNA
jgi:mannose-6-phosphate isomerase-like protein (cupin superfamily)